MAFWRGHVNENGPIKSDGSVESDEYGVYKIESEA